MKPYYLILLLWLSVAAQAAVTHDATSTATCVDPGTSISWSHTVTSGGANRIIIAAFHIVTHGTQEVISDFPTYAGANMTLLSRLGDTDSFATEIWYKVNPATGANTLAATISASTNVCAGAWSFTNVHQSTPFGTPVTSISGWPNTVNVSSASNEIVIDAITSGDNCTVDGGQTLSWDQTLGAPVPDGGGGASRKTGAASVDMTWTAPDHYVRHIAVAVKEAAGSVPALMTRRRRI